MAINQQMTAREWAMLLTLSVLWGGSYFYVGVAVTALPPFTIVFLRVFIAAMALLCVLAVMGQRLPLGREAHLAFLGMGLLNNVIPMTLIVWAQGAIPSGLASILNATTPLFTVLVLHLFSSDEKANVPKVAGVLIGFSGVALMIGIDFLTGAGERVLPQLACLGASVSYAFSGLWGRRFSRLSIKPVVAASGQMCASTVLLLPVMVVFDRPWLLDMPGIRVWLAVLALALLSTSLAYILFFRILASAGATNLVLVTFLIPVSAILLGIMFLGEVLLPRHLLGMALVGCGLACIDGRLLARFRRNA